MTKGNPAIKIAWYSNSPWSGTGYGQQTALILPRLADRYGPDSTACVSNFGLSGGPMRLGPIMHFPTGFTPYSDEVAPLHMDFHFRGEQQAIAFTLFDVWPLSNPAWAKLPLLAAWVPVDHLPPPPGVIAFFKAHNAVPIAMSRWGETWLRKAGLDPMYAPHAIDTAAYRPTPVHDGRPCREAFGIPADVFVVGMVAANKGVMPNRKSFPEAFQAFSVFREKHPDAIMYCHTAAAGDTGGVDLRRVMRAVGLPEDAVKFSDPYLSRMPLGVDAMAALYSSFDVLLQPSRGEGFGIPAIEAQACGVPVIGTDFSAQSEIIKTGWLVGGHPELDLAQDSWLMCPSVDSIVTALTECFDRDPVQVDTDSAEARQWVVGEYDINTVWDRYWIPVLDRLETMLPSTEPIDAEPIDAGKVNA